MPNQEAPLTSLDNPVETTETYAVAGFPNGKRAIDDDDILDTAISGLTALPSPLDIDMWLTGGTNATPVQPDGDGANLVRKILSMELDSTATTPESVPSVSYDLVFDALDGPSIRQSDENDSDPPKTFHYDENGLLLPGGNGTIVQTEAPLAHPEEPLTEGFDPGDLGGLDPIIL